MTTAVASSSMALEYLPPTSTRGILAFTQQSPRPFGAKAVRYV
jgi:hypothetical protein